jgi:alkylation response protein AidB-like acyl-CoA dehydrogenase
MADNFFTDNRDLQYQLERLDLRTVVDILENGYRYSAEYPGAPRNYDDAKDNWQILLTVLGDICANHVAPRAAEAAEEGAQFRDGQVEYAAATQEALKLLRQADLMGAMLPWEYGGLNMPETIFQMMVEIISRAEAGLMTIFGLQEISVAISEFADEETKASVLPRFARGELTGAMVLTEPDAGSDLGVVQTRAFYDEANDQWYINGVKRFITNGNADVLLVLARSEADSTDARGLSLYLIEADDSVIVRRLENKMGIHASPTCEVQFNNTPAKLIGKRRFGLIRYAMGLMNGARLAVSAQALGIAEAAYREAYQYAEQRVQFGESINALPAVYRMLLSMRAEIEATRALVYETSRWVDLKKAYEHLKSAGALSPDQRTQLRRIDRLADVLTPLVKYYATEMGNRVCFQAMQIHGGAGYMQEFNVERHFRDIRVTNIYEGTSQLQVVAATGGLLGHALDELLNDWAALDYGPDLAALKQQMEEGTAVLNRSIDHLREQDDRALIDYYAVDVVDIATFVVNGWLVLQDARTSERKRELARFYIAESMPKIRGKVATIQGVDPAIPQTRDVILAPEF